MSDRKPPYTVCPADKEPLIGTFRYPGAEFVCMICGSLYGFLEPSSAPETPELKVRHEYLDNLFSNGTEPGKVTE